jgi:nuclear transcription Y subunit beta
MDRSENIGGENKEHDRYLPIANIGRIMKLALPKETKIAKEARETV